MSNQNKDAYKDIKNYIHNELGVTKEYIQDVVKDTVAYELKKLLNDNTFMDNIVKSQIREVMNKDFESPTWKRIFNLDTEIYNAVCDEVSRTVKNRLEIRFKED